MPNANDVDDRATKRMRWIAWVWGALIVILALLVFIGSVWSWVMTGEAGPYAVEDYSPIENLPPLFALLSAAGCNFPQ